MWVFMSKKYRDIKLKKQEMIKISNAIMYLFRKVYEKDTT